MYLCVCLCGTKHSVAQDAVEAWFLFGWLLGRKLACWFICWQKHNSLSCSPFLSALTLLVSSGYSPFFIFPFPLLLLQNPLSLPPSSVPAMLQKLPLLIHKNALHTWLSSRGTGAWFNSPAHTHTFPCLYTLLAFLTPPLLVVYLLQTALSFSSNKAKVRSICVLLCINTQSQSSPLAQKDIRETNINIVFWPLCPLVMISLFHSFFVFIFPSIFHTTCIYCGCMFM